MTVENSITIDPNMVAILTAGVRLEP